MKTTRLCLLPNQGLTLLLAQKIAFAVRQMKAVVILRASGGFADSRNILSILAMCAAMGSTIDFETYGPDEIYAARTLERILVEETQDLPGDDSSKTA
jgi:phosphotransferase system HPr-like phosphotransfer protein